MNPKKCLIFLKGEEKTEKIDRIQYNREKRIWQVKFVGGSQSYNYKPDDIIQLFNPEWVNLEHNQFEYKGKPFYKVKSALKFNSYYRFFFENGKSKVYHVSGLTIHKSCLVSKDASHYLRYYTELADKISLKSDEGTSLLGKQFRKLTFVNEQTVLASYINLKKYPLKRYMDQEIIFPFGCNESQKQAVQMALLNQVSIVEGPPGTGKTQTILNLIANLLIQNKTIAVISNNNSAIENVQEKMEKYDLSYLCAMLGKGDNKREFILDQELHTFDPPEVSRSEWKSMLIDADRKQKEIQEYLELNNKLAGLETTRNELELEQKHFINYMEETFPKTSHEGYKWRISSTQILKLKIALEDYADKSERTQLNWIQKLRYYIQYRIRNRAFLDCSLDEIITEFEREYYVSKINEINEEIDKTKNRLNDFSYEEKQKELQKISLQVLKQKVAQKFVGYTDHYLTEDDFWKNPGEVIERYPVILSTTHSIRTSLSGIEYDYIIVDEASQVDLLTGVLAMSCAKNMVIVGDDKQLPNVVTDQVKKKVNEIETGFSLPASMKYAEHSLLTSAKASFPDAPCIILREHYRCHPRIIQFCNKKFYENKLIIMTKDKGEMDVLKVYKTVAGSHARERINRRQIEEIKQQVLPELLENKISEEKIGIISPYRAQVEEMADSMDEELSIDTVHKFQGREKDAIVIATVDNQITEFTDNPNLLNVAVSRAVSKLRLVVSDHEKNENTNIGDLIRYIMYEKGEIIEGKVYSVFDLLYKEYKEIREEYLRNRKKVSNVDSENLFYHFIKEVLEHEEIVDFDIAIHVPVRMLIKDMEGYTEKEIKYALNRGTHVDFLLFRTVDKSPVLAIEIDGYEFHKKGTKQRDVRDEMKDRIFEKAGLKLLRFSTTGSGEDEKLREVLKVYK